VVVDQFSLACMFYGSNLSIFYNYSGYSLSWIMFTNYMVYLQLIVNDRDTIFSSQFWRSAFAYQGVELHYSIACHPQMDGKMETVNKCLENYLRCMTGNTPHQWSRWLSLAKWWYNTNYRSSIWSSTTTSYSLLP
jgi:transposase InsO family protein